MIGVAVLYAVTAIARFITVARREWRDPYGHAFAFFMAIFWFPIDIWNAIVGEGR